MLEALFAVGEAVKAKVDAASVLTRALDLLDQRLTDAEHASKTKCSYGAVLGLYTGHRILARHLRRAYHEATGQQTAELHNRWSDQERRIRALRVGMYSNVCQHCEACKSRRKPWPGHTQFAFMNQFVKDTAEVNRMLYRRESLNGTTARYVVEDEYAGASHNPNVIEGEVTCGDIYKMMQAALKGDGNMTITVDRKLGMVPELAMGYNTGPSHWHNDRYRKQ